MSWQRLKPYEAIGVAASMARGLKSRKPSFTKM
jgi:hypothetical protein